MRAGRLAPRSATHGERDAVGAAANLPLARCAHFIIMAEAASRLRRRGPSEEEEFESYVAALWAENAGRLACGPRLTATDG